MKKYLISLIMVMVLMFAGTAHARCVGGDIDFSNLNINTYLYAEQIGNYIERIHEYPDEDIKIVKVITFGMRSQVKTVSYFKDNELFVWEHDPNRENLYFRVPDLSPETIRSITDTLKAYLK